LDLNIIEKAKTIEVSRRSFLKKSAIITGAAMMTQSEILAATGEKKTLKLYNVHLNKMFYAPFFEKNYYKLSGLFEVNKAFIDYRAKEMIRVDVKLVNLLYEIKQHLGYDKQFNIVSGYRSPRTNAALSKRREGVAKHSYHIKGQAVDIYVPNVFTPDGDGLNDYFYIKTGKGVKNINRLMIFNNWGDKLFDKKDLRKNVPVDGWNGEFRGKKAGLGVYVYVFELELEDGSKRRVAGDVTIIK